MSFKSSTARSVRGAFWARHWRRQGSGRSLASAGLLDLNTVWGLRAYVYRTGFANFERGDNREPLKRLETVRNWIFDGGVVRFEHLRAAAVRAALGSFWGFDARPVGQGPVSRSRPFPVGRPTLPTGALEQLRQIGAALRAVG